MSTQLILVLLLGTWALLLIRSWRRDRRFIKETDVFPCRIRLVRGWVPGLTGKWRGRPRRARWVHDVLIFRSGWITAHNCALPVRTVVGSVRTSEGRTVRRLGKCPVLVRLQLDLDQVIEVAAPSDARELIAGPFVVAGVLHSTTSPARDDDPGTR